MKRLEGDGIYLDHNATTPLDAAVAEAMKGFMDEGYGNPSSPYPLGTRAKEALENARGAVARILGCSSPEIVFTSGGSESPKTSISSPPPWNTRRS